MIDDIYKYLHEQMNKVTDLYCLIITDRDGVPIIKLLNDKCPDTSMKPAFFSTFSTASDQASKLGLGKNESILCIYSNFQILQVNNAPFIMRYIASNKVNTGHVYTLHEMIQPVIEELKMSIGQAVVQ